MTAPADSALTTVLVIVGVLGALVGIATYVWYAFALSRLFPRIDGEGWKGWVPVLNEAEILARGGIPAWSVVFYFIPLVQFYGLYLKIVATHRINKRFGRGAGMTVLAVLLPPVWATVLAWGAAPYPEGDRLAALQPGSGAHRSAPPAAAPARDASGYTIPSLVPSGNSAADAPALVFPDYAPPSRTDALGATPAAPTGVPAPDPAVWGAPQQFAVQPPFADSPVRSFTPPPVPPPAPQPATALPSGPSGPSGPVQEHPPTGIMAAMSGLPGSGQQAKRQPVADHGISSADAPQRAVRPAPPSFREDAVQDAEPQPPTIRPAPEPSAGAFVGAESIVAAHPPEQPAAPVVAAGSAPLTEPNVLVSQPTSPAAAAELIPDVGETVVTPRPTDDELDATVVVARKRGVRRVLVLDDGRRFSLSGASVVIGRNPIGGHGEQRLAISDTTRTLSKTHARLVVQEDEWRLTDLHATNGVVVVADDGAEVLLDPGESVVGTGRFILGEVGMHVVAERDS